MTQVVNLKNGTQEAKVAVVNLMSILCDLADTDPIAIYELHQKCQNRDHKFYGNYQQTLTRRKLLEDSGFPHNTVRNILLSAYVSKGDWDFALETPIASAPIGNMDHGQ